MPARRPARPGHPRATRSPRGLLESPDIVRGAPDATHDVAFGVTERHRSAGPPEVRPRGGLRPTHWQPSGAPGGAMPGHAPLGTHEDLSAVIALCRASAAASQSTRSDMNNRPRTREPFRVPFDKQVRLEHVGPRPGAAGYRRRGATSKCQQTL